MDRFEAKKAASELDLNIEANITKKSNPRDLIRSKGLEFSSSSSNSSSSSLASSTLSLTSNSSASTVLALSGGSIRQTDGDSKQTAQLKLSSSSSPTLLKGLSKCVDQIDRSISASDEEEDDPNQPTSSASSTSSSGLSSMNSSSHQSNHSESSIIRSQAQSSELDNEISTCLNQIVDSVAAGQDSNKKIHYETFKLHEAIYAKTRSASGSSDDDSQAGQTAGSNKLSRPSAIQEAGDDLTVEIQLVREIHLDPLDLVEPSRLCETIRKSIPNATDFDKPRAIHDIWFGSIKTRDKLIEWRNSSSKDRVGSMGLDRIIDCFVDGRSTIWIVHQELETTLDDIAIALDESPRTSSSTYQNDFHTLRGLIGIVWLCSNEYDARRLKYNFRFYCNQIHDGLTSMSSKQKLDSIQATRVRSGDRGIESNRKSSLISNDAFEKKENLDEQVELFADSSSQNVPKTSAKISDNKQRVSNLTSASNSASEKLSLPRSVASNGIKVSENENLASGFSQTITRGQRTDASKGLRNEKLVARAGKLDDIDIKQEIQAKGAKPTNQTHDGCSTASKHTSKKSLNEQDLRAPISSSSSSSSSVASSSGLAGYYRDVASRVISNGQSKIKRIKDEVIKLNSRIPASTTSRRTSMAAIEESRRKLGGSVHSLVSVGKSAASSSSSMMKAAVSVANLSSSTCSIPEAKPRTSILKNSLQKEASNDSVKCDVESNFSTRDDNVARRSRYQTISYESPTSNLNKTPKSILKPTKQAQSNNDKQIQTLSYSPPTSISDHNNNTGSSNDLHRSQHPMTSRAKDFNPRTDNRRRRSTYSDARIDFGSVERSLNGNGFSDDEDDEGESAIVPGVDLGAKTAFERLGKQRVSCYDISHLMSKDGITQAQLERLRSNSVAFKSRQRRPALLLAEASKVNETNADCDSVRSAQTENHKKLNQATDRPCSIIGNIKTISSGDDGIVRANVNSSQLKRSLTISGPRRADLLRHQQNMANKEASRKGVDERSVERSVKRSEFDPKHLKRHSVRSEQAKSKTQVKIETLDGSQPISEDLQEKRKSKIILNNPRDGDSVSHRVSETNKSSRESTMENESNDSLSTEANEEDEESDTLKPVSSLIARKQGPFSLLRQSFKQTSLSSVLRFPNRASLRVKQGTSKQAQTQDSSVKLKDQSVSIGDRDSALAMAEASLLAAKQLKQQAQKLMEQQKRDREQQQIASLDQTNMILAAAAAVQYNQQIQRQQQIIYQQAAAQQFALGAARGQQLYDHNMHLQHQMLVAQRQQQQSLAYMANMSSAQYMTTAQQIAMIGPIGQIPMGHLHPAQQQMPVCIPPSAIPVATGANQASTLSGIFKQSLLRGSSSKPQQQVQASSHQMIYHRQSGSQYVPMSVNHHSSLNIVYSGSGQGPDQGEIARPQPAKQSSIGATVKKTMKSILVNRLQSSEKSVLRDGRSKNPRSVALNSEGSADSSDSSSNDSTPRASPPRLKGILSRPTSNPSGLKSALKKNCSQPEILSSSSDSSCSSLDVDLRGKTTATSNGRKNVTFSSKLTSIL